MKNDLLEDFDEVDVEELQKMIAQGDTVLIDVREENEYKVSHISGAVNIPLSELTRKKVVSCCNLHANTKNIVFQCQSGKRSLKALLSMEHENIAYNLFNLDGGILSWKSHNKEVIS